MITLCKIKSGSPTDFSSVDDSTTNVPGGPGAGANVPGRPGAGANVPGGPEAGTNIPGGSGAKADVPGIPGAASSGRSIPPSQLIPHLITRGTPSFSWGRERSVLCWRRGKIKFKIVDLDKNG